MPKTRCEFRSDEFPPCEGEDEMVNPGLWGKRLAEYLERALEGEGIETEGITAEDWGWIVFVKNDGFPLWIGCGHQNGGDDSFLCFIHPDRPVVRRWLKRIDTTSAVARLASALEKILTTDPAIRELRWSNDAGR